jgi:predicted O-methyltransferase YrrM
VDHIKLVFRYIKYWRKGQSKLLIHSPFVYEFMTEVLLNPYPYYAYDKVEEIREELLTSDQLVSITDFGAGSRLNNSNQRKVSEIAKNAAKPKKFAQLLHRIVAFYKPKTMLELGTSLGVSSMYQATGSSNGHLITMEGCPETAKVAQANFDRYPIKNIEIVVGDFAKTLDPTFNKIDQLDYAFFDGNHRKVPTMEYFHKALEKKHDRSIFIFDDIHWSDEMEEAWDEIKKHPEVTITIDLFFIGLVFFKKDQAKQDFILRFPFPKESAFKQTLRDGMKRFTDNFDAVFTLKK